MEHWHLTVSVLGHHSETRLCLAPRSKHTPSQLHAPELPHASGAAQGIAATTGSLASSFSKPQGTVSWCGSGQFSATGVTTTRRQPAAGTRWNRTWLVRRKEPPPVKTKHFPWCGAQHVKFNSCPPCHLGK